MYHKLRKCLNSRRSHQRCYIEKVVLNIHRKKIVLESLFNRLASFKTCDFLKKRFQHRCFFVKFAKFLRTPFWRTSTNGSFWIYQGLYALPLNDFKETYQMEKPIFKVPKSITEATFWIIIKNDGKLASADILVSFLKGRMHYEVFLSEYFMKYQFTLISQCTGP